MVRIALVQMQPCRDAKLSLDKAQNGIEAAAKRGAEIICLPELFLGPYFCQRKDDRGVFKTAEMIPGPTTDALSKTAKQYGVVLVGGSLFEKTPDGTYFNTTPVFGPEGALLGIYRKTHIPEDPLFHEQHYFSPGDTGIRVFDSAKGKLAPLICYDQWYPETARLAALSGAEVLFYPTAIGLIDAEVEENITGDWEGMWRAAQVGHAACNNIFVASLNRVGREGAIQFWGGSFIAAPSGEILACAGNKEEILIADCDLSRVEALQKAWRFLENRRPESYKPLIR